MPLAERNLQPAWIGCGYLLGFAGISLSVVALAEYRSLRGVLTSAGIAAPSWVMPLTAIKGLRFTACPLA